MSRLKRRDLIIRSADQVEIAAYVRDEPTPIGVGAHDDRVDGSLDDTDAPTARSSPVTRGRALDELQGRITEEIDRRSTLLGQNYPFKRNGGSLIYEASETLFYEYLLATAMSSDYSGGRYRIVPRVFEVASCQVAESYLGPHSQSYRTGWPRPHGEPDSLKNVIQKLRSLTGDHPGEWHWGPKEGKPENPSTAVAKEQGLDLVAWKPSPDGRTGQLYLLGQCACGLTWNTDAKLQDLDIDKLKGWIREIAPVDPVKSIFTPHHADDDSILEASRGLKGLVFDRARMVLLAQQEPLRGRISSYKKKLRRLVDMCANS